MSYSSILVIKLTSLGDVVMCVPAVEALRKTYPDAKIGWVTEDKSAEALEDYKTIDKLYIFEKKKIEKWAKLKKYFKIIKYIKDFAKNIEKDGWEISIDLQGHFRSALIAYLAKIPKRVGSAPGLHKIFLTERVVYSQFKGGHAIEWYLFVLKNMGLIEEPYEINYFFPLSEEKKNNAKNLIAPYRPNNFLIGISPFTKWESKNWPLEYYEQLISKIEENLNTYIFFFGTEQERYVIENQFGNHPTVINFAGKLSISEFAAVLGQLDLFISADTGPMHLAASMGIKQIALFGPTHAEKTGPYNKKAKIMKVSLHCAPCFKKSCPLPENKNICMKNIFPEIVYAKVVEMLKENGEKNGK